MKISVVLPAYNEAATIERAVRETQVAIEAIGEGEIIVVDDGSHDDTAGLVGQLAKTLPSCRLINHEKNRGKGAAVAAGVRAARGDVIVFLDCDLSVHPREILEHLSLLEQTDIVIGSRRVAGARIVQAQPWQRTQLGRVFNFFVRHYLDLPYFDTQCGFKLFKYAAAKQVFSDLTTGGWAFDVELLVRAQACGWRVREAPVSWSHGRETRVHLRDAWRIWEELRAIKRRCVFAK